MRRYPGFLSPRAAKESPEVVTDFNEFGNGETLRPQERFQRQFDGMGEKVVAGGK